MAADGTAHPVFFYIATQIGMGITVAQLCAACEFDVERGPMIVATQVEFVEPLRVGVAYGVQGEIVSLTRKSSRKLGVMDLASISAAPGDTDRATSLHHNQHLGAPARSTLTHRSFASGPKRSATRTPFTSIRRRSWRAASGTVSSVRVLANLALIITMLQTADPGARLSSLDVRYLDNVFAGDSVEPGFEVTATEGSRVTCKVWPEHRDRGNRSVRTRLSMTWSSTARPEAIAPRNVAIP